MSFELTLRYALELSLLIPAVTFAMIPVTGYLRVRPVTAFISSAFIMAAMISAGAYFGVYHKIRVRVIAIPIAVTAFMLYMLAVNTEIAKKLFCFSNALMLCVICPMYTIFINAPHELMNFSGIFKLSSGIMSVIISVIIGALFFRTLSVKFPMLLKEDSIRDIWRYMFMLPLAMSAVIYWMTPNFPAVVLAGRVRPVGLMLLMFLTVEIFMLYHIFWHIVSKLTERAKLQQANGLLMMENKRYKEMRSYMEVTRALRHDFRQHIFVMSELSQAGRISELEAYISQLAEHAGRGYKSFCANSAVDAIASHYDRLAEEEGATISWRLELPSILSVKEPDFCALLGNLAENALKAVKNLPQEKRKINVISSMLSDAMLGLSVSNEYEGSITFGENGLPVSNIEGHGTGLLSVMNTVNYYGGNMNISTGNNIFSVDIILYF